MRATVLALTLLLSLLPATSASAADAEMTRGSNYLQLATDLDGDGVRDTVAIEYTPATQDTPLAGIGGNASVVTARRGTDGSTLWSKQIPVSLLVPIRVGADGRPGILAVDGPTVSRNSLETLFVYGDEAQAAAGVDTRALTLTALDGLTGGTAWTRTFETGPFLAGAASTPAGVTPKATVMSNHTAFVDVMDAGAGDQVLVTRLNRTETPAGTTSTTNGLVLKGSDGTDAFKVDVASDSARPVVRNGGDLNGDGRDDLLFLRTLASGGLRAFSGADGNAIWDAPAVPVSDWFDVSRQGDLDGDGKDEVFVAQGNAFTDEGATHVVDGATGKVRYSAPATTMITPVGNAVGDSRSELATVAASDNKVTVRLVSLDGDVIASREHVTTVPDGTMLGGVGPSGPVGDVDGDGVADVAYRVEYHHDGTYASDLGLISGRTLSLIRERVRGVPVGRAVTAGTSDFMDTTISQGQVELALQDGSTGAKAWTTYTPSFFDGATFATANTFAEDVNHDGVQDVLATVTLSKMTCSIAEVPESGGCLGGTSSEYAVRTFALSGRNGAILWQI